MKKLKIILAGILVSVVLFACLGALGYFGTKTMRRSQLRMEAREAFAAEDWKKAEKLLNEYVGQDPDSEEDFVRLAQVYRHFGNLGEELRCWARADMLNPLKPEYWDNYIGCAMNARDFGHLYSTLNRKIVLEWDIVPRDRMLYLICMCMTGRIKEAEQLYTSMRRDSKEKEQNVFQENDLARYAEFLVVRDTYTSFERSNYIDEFSKSDDPFVRLEAILQYLIGLERSGEDLDYIFEQEETMLNRAAAENRFVAIPLLANVYFSNLKFGSVIEIAEPYLADIDNILLAVLYAESCVYDAQPEKLKPLAEHYRTLGWRYRLLASYFEALFDFSQGPEKNDDLARHMQEAGGVVRTDLTNLIDLQIALNNDNLEKIVSSLETIMKNPPFHNLREKALTGVRHYLGTKVEGKPELAEDPSMVRLARLISEADKKDPFLMRITISDLRKRNMLTRQILQENLEAFPLDPYLLEAAAEFELFNGNPKQCLEYVERFYGLKDEKRSIVFDLLHMLALELCGKVDEAAEECAALVENNEMNRNILYRYLRFCIDHERGDELSKMADRLDASDAPDLKSLAPFFRVEELLLQEKKDEALSLLETAKTDHPDFALRAANLCSAFDMLDQALSRYLALVGNYPDQQLVFANIAEIYLAKEMKAEALSYAERAWEANRDNGLGQFVYAKMLVANGRYHDAERVLRIPRRKIELSEAVRELWKDIMSHCVREDLSARSFLRALDRINYYLLVYPEDPAFLEFKAQAEQELRKEQDARNPEKDADMPLPL